MTYTDQYILRSEHSGVSFWKRPATLKEVKLGKLYEIPGDGNDRFFAEANSHCTLDGVVRFVIKHPARFIGMWAFCEPSDARKATVAEMEAA